MNCDRVQRRRVRQVSYRSTMRIRTSRTSSTCTTSADSPHANDPDRAASGAPFAITTRQLEIARHVVEGKTAREIAMALVLSRRTVESHIDALKTRLDCVNRCQLTAKLIRLGIAPDE
ncbi:MAG: LuxR family transcriptional regulator [Paraburkholderia sp.]|nr:MAG: LuxR family transcriptional regulator [Paraburkholderia sp.]